MLKRFKSSELGESASRRVGYDCMADYAKSSKAKCRVCNRLIEQNSLRFALMLQDEEGYKSTAWTHYECFWTHRETKKLSGIEEIHNFSKLKAEDREKISKAFEKLHGNQSVVTNKQNKRTHEEEGADDDVEAHGLSNTSIGSMTNLKEQKCTSNKRRRSTSKHKSLTK